MTGFLPDQDFAFFADEAGVSNDRYVFVGGVAVHRDRIAEINQQIADFRSTNRMFAEMKYSRAADQKYDEYFAFSNIFFDLLRNGHIKFHCIFFDSHEWNHKKYNDGDGDVGLSKLYFQLILHKFVRILGPHGTLFVCLDRRISSTSLESLRRMVNRVAMRDHGFAAPPLKLLISRDSKKDDILQLNDVILGAVCAHRNGRHENPNTRLIKQELPKFVLASSGLRSFDRTSFPPKRRFSVWQFRPQPR